MRALAVNPTVNGKESANRYTTYTNDTLTKMWQLTPTGTSCVFIEFKLYTTETDKAAYSHKQIRILKDTTRRTKEMISMQIDTSKTLNEKMWIQA
jgi:hypothetical protein